MNSIFKSILLISLALISFSTTVSAQRKKKKNKEEIIITPSFNYENNKIIYTEKITASGSKTDLYKKGTAWFNGFYKNAANVYRKRDETAGLYNGKPKFRIYTINAKTGKKSQSGLVMYTISFQFSDGSYTYRIEQIQEKKSSPFPIERWESANKKEYNRPFALYLNQVDEEIKRIITSFKSAL